MHNNYQEKIINFHAAQKRMPSYAEMAKLFGFKSKNAVFRVVQKLLDAGIVAKDSLGRLVPTGFFNEIPLLGSVKAGLPSPTEMMEDTIDLNNLLIQKRDKTYLVTVDGDSMIDAHIADGDWVIVERTNVARDGDIVIANIDGEFTMKFLRQNTRKTWLEPANENFQPMYPEHNLEVIAIVRGVIRKY